MFNDEGCYCSTRQEQLRDVMRETVMLTDRRRAEKTRKMGVIYG